MSSCDSSFILIRLDILLRYRSICMVSLCLRPTYIGLHLTISSDLIESEMHIFDKSIDFAINYTSISSILHLGILLNGLRIVVVAFGSV